MARFSLPNFYPHEKKLVLDGGGIHLTVDFDDVNHYEVERLTRMIVGRLNAISDTEWYNKQYPTVEERVKNIVLEFFFYDSWRDKKYVEIDYHKTFEQMGADSLDLVEFVMTVEDEFDIEMIDDKDAEKLTSVSAVLDYLKSRGIE